MIDGLPKHGERFCIGYSLHGEHEECDRPVAEGSPFPFCEAHYQKILSAPRKRTCSGAITYDNAMRPRKIECHNLTGGDDIPLCAYCRVIETREKARAREAFGQGTCPHCGRSGPVPQKPTAPRMSSYRDPRGYTQGTPKYTKDNDE